MESRTIGLATLVINLAFLGIAHADHPPVVLARQGGVVFKGSFNQPFRGCMWGTIHNDNDHRVEVVWVYHVEFENGQAKEEHEDDYLPAHRGLGGWAKSSVCGPSGQRGGFDGWGRVTRIELRGIQVIDVNARKAQEEAARTREAQRQEQIRQDEERRRREEQARQEEERKRQEEQKRQDQERKRQDEERKRQEQRRLDEERAARERRHSAQKRGDGQRARSRQTHQAAVDPRAAAIARDQQRREDAYRANQQAGAAAATTAAAVFGLKGGSVPRDDASRLFRTTFGFGMRFWPVMANASGGGITPFSNQDTGGGLGFDLDAEWWPRFRANHGLGAFATVTAAGFALPGGGQYGPRAASV